MKNNRDVIIYGLVGLAAAVGLDGWANRDFTDRTYLIWVLIGIAIAMLKGASVFECLKEGQDENRELLERLAEEQRENRTLLEKITAEQEKLRRQRVRDAIMLEGLVAALPADWKTSPEDDDEPGNLLP